MRDIGVQGPGDGDEEFDIREIGKEERGLYSEVAAGGRADAGETGEVGTGGPGGGKGEQGVVEPVPEGFDIGKNVGGVGLREESVRRGDEEGGGGEAEF